MNKTKHKEWAICPGENLTTIPLTKFEVRNCSIDALLCDWCVDQVLSGGFPIDITNNDI